MRNNVRLGEEGLAARGMCSFSPAVVVAPSKGDRGFVSHGAALNIPSRNFDEHHMHAQNIPTSEFTCPKHPFLIS